MERKYNFWKYTTILPSLKTYSVEIAKLFYESPHSCTEKLTIFRDTLRVHRLVLMLRLLVCFVAVLVMELARADDVSLLMFTLLFSSPSFLWRTGSDHLTFPCCRARKYTHTQQYVRTISFFFYCSTDSKITIRSLPMHCPLSQMSILVSTYVYTTLLHTYTCTLHVKICLRVCAVF